MSVKSILLGPFAMLLYQRMLRMKQKEAVMEDIKFWSDRIYDSPFPQKSFFINKMLYDPKFRTLFYHRVRCSRFFKVIFPPADFLFIHSMTKVAPGGIFFVHPWCTYIFAKEIGRHCVIRQLTTIGTRGDRQIINDIPIIGDNVDIGCNCGIFGDIVIGNNVKIGAGTILTKSVPDNCVVVGNPARIMKQNGVRVNIIL